MISYIDTKNNVTYGISCRGKEVMKDNAFKNEIIIIPYCENKDHCKGTLMTSRDEVGHELDILHT